MTINYCLRCAAPLKKINYTHYHCENGHDFWNNPKATVVIAIVNNKNQVLVAERGEEPKIGKFQLPGGFIDHGENGASAIEREVKEETGLVLNTYEMLTTVAHDFTENVGLCDIVYFSNDWTGEPKALDDVASLQWKPIDFINSKQWAWDFRGVAKVLKERLQI